MSVVLVTGPTRSGKSEWAETLAARSHKSVIYVATAQDYLDDPEWQDRISRHQQRRSPHWETRSVPMDLSATLRAATPHQCLLVDALGTWLANWLEHDESTWDNQVVELLTCLQATESEVILVAEEVGGGARLPVRAAISRSPRKLDPPGGGDRRYRLSGYRRVCAELERARHTVA